MATRLRSALLGVFGERNETRDESECTCARGGAHREGLEQGKVGVHRLGIRAHEPVEVCKPLSLAVALQLALLVGLRDEVDRVAADLEGFRVGRIVARREAELVAREQRMLDALEARDKEARPTPSTRTTSYLT